MRAEIAKANVEQGKRRLSKSARHEQLLDIALKIVREEGADRLTLGHLAVRAGVSKPIAYDHFGTRSALLIELYRKIDTERVDAFQELMATGERTADEAVSMLAKAFIECAADGPNEFHAIGAALGGSEEKAVVYQELLDHSVAMFVAVLLPHSALPLMELERRCVALVGAGEALSVAFSRGLSSGTDTIATFESMIWGALNRSSQIGSAGSQD